MFEFQVNSNRNVADYQVDDGHYGYNVYGAPEYIMLSVLLLVGQEWDHVIVAFIWENEIINKMYIELDCYHLSLSYPLFVP